MSGPNEERPLTYLAVTSHLPERLIARFHGEDYEWEPEETVKLSLDAARHIFGFGLEDKAAAYHRLGWLNTRPDGTFAHAQAKLAKIAFAPVKQVFEINPAASPRRARKASGSDRSLAAAGDSAEAGSDSSASATPFTVVDDDEAAEA